MPMNDSEREMALRRKEIARRRGEKRRKQNQQLCKRLLVLLSVLAVIAIAALSLTVLFPVKNIRVVGENAYTSEQVIQASGIRKGANLWMAGGQAETSITTKLPYIAGVTLKRGFPDTITIQVKKAVSTVCYQVKDTYLLCDAENKLLSASKQQPADLLVVFGSTAKADCKAGQTVAFENQDVAQLIQQLISAMKANKVSVQQMDLSDIMSITLQIEKRFSVRFGSAANMQQKIAHLAEMIQKIDPVLKGDINLSYWSQENPKGIFTQQ